MEDEFSARREAERGRFKEKFYLIAIYQGRIAYLLMSLYLPNTQVLSRYTTVDFSKYLFPNMVYGLGIMIYTRPSISMISPFHKLSFSCLGSLMLNYASCLMYDWLKEHISNTYILSLLGFVSGRIAFVHFIAFLYHMDSRTIYRGRRIIRDPAFEVIVMGSLMFNHTSLLVFQWLNRRYSHRPILLFLLGYFSGRIMLFYFDAILYHIDRTTIYPGRRAPKIPHLERIYY